MATQKTPTREQRRARRKVRQSKPCDVHAFVEHGREAEELRAGIEGLMATKTVDDEYGDPAVPASALQELLDEVDARDSLAFTERKPQSDATDQAAAYVRDRAHQWDESSGIYSALLEVASQLERGEHVEAAKHGELDDLLEAIRKRRAPGKIHATGRNEAPR